VFLQLDGVVKGFCFNDPSSEASAPAWHMLFAERKGIFAIGFAFRVLSTELGSKGLVSRQYQAKVVSQLRYEYALNLMQRLGTSLTRVGLDFVGPVAGT
jgi:hypothetical protein